MKDSKLDPFTMNDQELELFVKTLLKGREFNKFQSRDKSAEFDNRKILEEFEPYLGSLSYVCIDADNGFMSYKFLDKLPFTETKFPFLSLDVSSLTSKEALVELIRFLYFYNRLEYGFDTLPKND